MNHEPDIDKIYLYAKDPYKANYQCLINKRENKGLKKFHDSKALLNIQKIWMIFIKILIVFDDMIPDMLSNK